MIVVRLFIPVRLSPQIMSCVAGGWVAGVVGRAREARERCGGQGDQHHDAQRRQGSWARGRTAACEAALRGSAAASRLPEPQARAHFILLPQMI